MTKENLEKEAQRSIREFDLACEEFFKDKSEPKTEEEDKKQQQEFYYWYNYARKQSDTGKTPAEMYKEAYGKEPSQNLPIDSQEPSRMMNFEWDEAYDEDGFEENEEKRNEELMKIAEQAFESGVWQKSKAHLKDMSKRDVARHMFILGFSMHSQLIQEQMNDIVDELKDMSPEEIEKMVKDFKERTDDNKEDKNE